LPHSAAALGLEVEVEWAATAPLEEDLGPIEHVDAIVCAPGSPYRSLLGAVEALRFARQSGLPSLGTCGGCQHMIIEYARNVLGFEDAQHAEYDPYSSQLFVSELACSVAGQTMPVNLEPGSRASRVYGAERVEEQYYCNFGLNPDYRQVLDGGGFRIVGVDDDDASWSYRSTPSMSPTLYVPRARSTPAAPHPLITALPRAAVAREPRVAQAS
jgi:CTP synthase (UTP-ammonia lyase)